MPLDLATDLTFALDPAVMAEACGYGLDPWQQRVVRSSARRQLLNCSRQSGKSTTVAVGAVHHALYVPGSLTLIVSPGERQSKETLKKITSIYHALDVDASPGTTENVLELALENGSRIVALPGVEGTIRGYSGVSLLIVDEASRVPDPIMAAVRPMLATAEHGRMIALSTPAGKRGWWYTAWDEGGPSWERVRITAHNCPRISAAFLEEERASLPAQWFAAEYLCEFTDALDQVFAYEDVMGALSHDVQPIFGGV